MEDFTRQLVTVYGPLALGWPLFIWMLVRNNGMMDKYIDLAVKTAIALDGLIKFAERLENRK